MKHFAVAALIGLAGLTGTAGLATATPLSGLSGMSAPAASVAEKALPLIRVQSTDTARISQLEEQIRSLNGRIEEMSFQLLQMQEQIRKFQEDNEFRFQDLEGGNTSTKKTEGTVTPPAGDTAAATGQQAIIEPPLDQALGTDPATTTTGAPPTTLGAVVFDENGNPVAATTQAQPSLEATLPGVETGINATPDSQQQTASLDNPGDLYNAAYNHVLTGDYGQAEQEFRDYISIFPEGEKVADASFWMGEAQYSQGKFNEAAKTFLDAHQAYATSPKAPEMLLKLGMSLAALDNKDTACATLREVGKRYPSASKAVKAKVTSEQSRLAC